MSNDQLNKKSGGLIIGKLWQVCLVFALFFSGTILWLLYTAVDSSIVRFVWGVVVGVAGALVFKTLWWIAPKIGIRLPPNIKRLARNAWRYLPFLARNTGLLFLYPERRSIPKKELNEFHFGPPYPSHLDIIGHTQAGIIDYSDKLIEVIKRGCHARVLILTDDDLGLQQVYEIGRSVKLGNWKTFKDKITATIDNFIELKDKVSHLNPQPLGTFEIKVTWHLLPYSMNRRDDEMFVFPYLKNPEGDLSPALHFTRGSKKKPHSLFQRYLDEFEELWKESKAPRVPDPYRVCISHHINLAKRIHDFADFASKNNVVLPEPVMITIFPTYLCSAHCSYCMYKNYRPTTAQTVPHIDKQMFESLLESCVSPERNNKKIAIELSGGGEPLEYIHIDTILQKMWSLRQEKDAHYGLLSNGLQITTDKIARQLVETFDYIRLSLPEEAEKDPNSGWRHNFNENLNRLIHSRNQYQSKCILGLKFLLRDKNKGSLLGTIEEFLKYYAVEHVKIKSVRSPDLTDDDICIFETDFYKRNFLYNRHNVHLDVRRTKFYRNFQCWLNPLQTVVAPDGSVYVCPNFVGQEDEQIMRLFSIKTGNDLWKLWGSKLHENKIFAIQKASNEHCAKTNHCNCRIFEYQELYELFYSRAKAFDVSSGNGVFSHFV